MKNKYITTFLVLFTSLKLFSQSYYVISFEGTGVYENDNRYSLFMDTISNPNTIWQIGAPQKTVFSSAATPPNAIVTDTLNVYPVNDTSSFILMHFANAGFSMPFEVLFGGKYFVNSDSLTDFGKIEFSPNNGSTWINLEDPFYASSIIWNHPYVQPVFTGNSYGWKNFRANIENLGSLFNIQVGDTLLFRFTFISDGNNTNKDGLMFDSLFVFDVPPVGFENINSNDLKLLAFPNPSTTTIHIEFDNSETEVYTIVIYDFVGRVVEEIIVPVHEGKMSIDTKNYPEGIYLYSLMNSNGHKVSSGKFMRVD